MMILHGRRFVELHNLRAFVKLGENSFSFCNSFSSSAAANADTSPPRDTVSYLVGSLGLTTKLAESISRKVSFENKSIPDSVLSLLRSHGFTDSQIPTIITDYPRLLVADAEKSLGPKLQFLLSRGASSSELTRIISKVPKILGKERSISRYYDFVKEVIEAEKGSKLCHSTLPQGSKQENKMRNIWVLRELGMPQRFLFSLLLSKFQPVSGKERFEESLNKVVEMGFDPTTQKFIKALHVFYQMSDKTIQAKVDVYKSLGFTVGQIWNTFKMWPILLIHSEKKILNSFETFLGLGFSRDEFVTMVIRQPACLNQTAETVKKKTEFLVKKMNWPLKAIVSRPQVLGYSMEKRLVPRCNVIKALMSKGLLGSEQPPMLYVLTDTDRLFLNKYVTKHDDKELVAELTGYLHQRPTH